MTERERQDEVEPMEAAAANGAPSGASSRPAPEAEPRTPPSRRSSPHDDTVADARSPAELLAGHLPERVTLVAAEGRVPFEATEGARASKTDRVDPNPSTFGGAGAVRTRVEPGSYASGGSADGAPESGRPGESFHGASLASDYTLLKFIAAGGQGEIWRATQGCLDRDVAVKIVKTAQSGSALLNFIQEAHTTAELDHPNIVPVYDLSRCRVGESDCHLMAMKLVRGTTWAKLLRKDRESPEFSLEGHLAKHLPILVDVCNAVAYAHSKEIIHRDLKPSQVVVGDFGEVYLLDWGLALSLDEATPPLAGGAEAPKFPTRRTSTNGTGTPAYMAPEQTLESTEALGFHTDVYLIGACLHEIATGEPPHRSDSLGDALARAKRNETVAPPANCPAEVTAALKKALATKIEDRFASVVEFRDALEDYLGGASRRRDSREALVQARRRLSEAGRDADYAAYVEADRLLSRALNLWPGNAAAEALRQETLERFATAALDARDLKLAGSLAPGLADDARRDDLVRRVEAAKLARVRLARQKALFGAAAAALGVCALVAAWGFLQSRSLANEQGRLAGLFRRVSELKGLEGKLAAKLAAHAPLPKTLGLGEDVAAALEAESAATPQKLGKLMSRREALRRERADLAADPVAAPLLGEEPFELALGVANAELARASKPSERLRAFQLYEAAHAVRPDLPQALTGMGVSSARAGYFASATMYLAEAEKLVAKNLGENHPERAQALALSAEALHALDDASPDFLKAYRSSLEILEPSWAETGLAMANRWRDLGEPDRAIAYASQALEAIGRNHGPNSYRAAEARLSLARALDARDRYAEAEENLRLALDDLTRLKGEKHVLATLAMDRLASTLSNMGKFGEAEAYFRKSMELRAACEPPDLVAIANSMNNLASLLFERGRHPEAEELLLKALEINREQVGDEHPNVAMGEYNLGQYYTQTGKHEEAERRLRIALDIAERRVGRDSPAVAGCLNVLASLYRRTGRLEESGRMLERALAIHEGRFGPDHYQVGVVAENIAALAYERGNYEEADRWYRRSLDIWGKTVGAKHPRAGATMSNLANIARRQGRPEEAERLFLEAIELNEAALGPNHPNVAGIKQNLGVLYSSMERYEEAEKLLREALDATRAVYGARHPNTATMAAGLASVAASLGRPDEAEALYLESVGTFESILGADSPKLATVVSSLARFYLETPGREADALLPAIRALRMREGSGKGGESLASSYMLAGEAALANQLVSAADPLFLRAFELLREARGGENSSELVNRLLGTRSILLNMPADRFPLALPVPDDLPPQALKLAAERERQLLACGRLPISSIAANWGTLHDLASTPALLLDPPRREAAARMAIRSAVLLELAGAEAKGIEEREKFLALRGEELGAAERIAEARKKARERIAELELTEENWVELDRLRPFLDEVAAPAIHWQADFPEVEDWSLASLAPSGDELAGLAEQALDLMRETASAQAEGSAGESDSTEPPTR